MKKYGKFISLVAAIVLLVTAGVLFYAYLSPHKLASQTTGIYNIHYVNYRGRTDVDVGFERELKKLGVRAVITYHDLNFNDKNADEIVKKIEADADVDLVITWGTTATLATIGRFDNPRKGRISTIPVIFTLVTAPKKSGIVPDGDAVRPNVTGTSHIAPLYNQFRSMMAYHPAAKVGMLFTPTELNSVITLQYISTYAAFHSVSLVAIGFNTGGDGRPNADNAKAAIDQMKREGVQWLYLPPDSFLGTQAKDVVIPYAHSLGIRTFASTEQLMKAGAGYGLITPYITLGEHTAQKAKKVLVDRIPAEQLVIDTVTRFVHQVNLDVLMQMELDIPLDKFQSLQVVTTLPLERHPK